MWAEANGGVFPSNDVVAVRFGDECFNETTFLGAPADVFDCLKSLLSALAMGIAVRFAALRTAGMGKLTGFAVPVLAGVLVYAVLTLVFRSEEAAGLIRAVCRSRGNAPEKGEKP